MAPERSQSTPPLVSFISGGVAGGVEGFLTYPFEFAKTRAQLHTPIKGTAVNPSRNPFLIIPQIYKAEGLRAMYKGCGILVVGSIAKDGVRFLSFDTVKNAFKDPETGTLSSIGSMLAGMTAGLFASIFAVTPTERIKTALIDDARSSKKFTSSIHCIKEILREDGFVGLYRGFAGTTLKQVSATSVRMGSYNIVKDFEERRGVSQTTGVNFANGAVAGTATTLGTMPFDTIKTRSQAAGRVTTLQAIRSIWADGGVKAFWRGTSMRLSRTVFSGGILFTTAEGIAKLLNPLIGR